MNTRNEEIRSFIEKYRNVLKALQMDIAHSELEDKWFIFKPNPIFVSGYDFFMEITDGEQLVNCILSELSYEMYAEIGVDDVDTPECEKNNISEMIDRYSNRDSLPTLTALLSYIKDNVAGRDSELMKTLESLVLVNK